MFCLYSSLFCSKLGSCRYSSNALTRETGACFAESIMFNQPLTSMISPIRTPDDETHVFEVGHGNVEHVLQPPCGIQVVDHLVVLLDKRLVDGQGFLCVRLDHLKVVFYRRLPILSRMTYQCRVEPRTGGANGPEEDEE